MKKNLLKILGGIFTLIIAPLILDYLKLISLKDIALSVAGFFATTSTFWFACLAVGSTALLFCFILKRKKSEAEKIVPPAPSLEDRLIYLNDVWHDEKDDVYYCAACRADGLPAPMKKVKDEYGLQLVCVKNVAHKVYRDEKPRPKPKQRPGNGRNYATDWQ